VFGCDDAATATAASFYGCGSSGHNGRARFNPQAMRDIREKGGRAIYWTPPLTCFTMGRATPGENATLSWTAQANASMLWVRGRVFAEFN
jgi:hypothetical protein